MKTQIGINGFGRIGRLAFRAAMANENVEIVGINAPDKSPELIAYTIKYDTVHGRYNGTVSYDEGAVIVDGKRIPLLSKRNAAELPWGELGAEYVMECTGKFLTTESAQAHIDAGASVVILSGPSKDATPHVRYGRKQRQVHHRHEGYLQRFLHHQLPVSHC